MSAASNTAHFAAGGIPGTGGRSGASTSDHGGDTHGSKAPPLKRGDACLYCRYRRIKCSAHKPSCHHCMKVNRKCEYDVGKPVSRVRKLERELAELRRDYVRLVHASQEAQRAAATAIAVTGSTASGPPTSIPQHTPITPVHPPHADGVAPGDVHGLSSAGGYYPAPGSFEHQRAQHAPHPGQSVGMGGMMDDYPSNPGGGGRMGPPRWFPPDVSAHISPERTVNFHASKTVDWETLDPNVMSLVNSFSEASTREHSESDNGHGMPTPAVGAPQPLPYVDTSMGGQVPVGTLQTPRIVAGHLSPAQRYQAFVEDEEGPVSSRDHRSFNLPGGGEWKTPEPSSTLVGGWHSPHDLPREARDQLLEYFFSGMRMMGQGYHVPRFMARQVISDRLYGGTNMTSLTLPPSRGPHPCLLHSMYLIVSRFSPSPKLRQLEPHFFEIASTQLSESVSRGDRLFDATRAATLLTVYHYSLGQYVAGGVMAAQAGRLAFSCGLHQISSSVFKPSTRPQEGGQGVSLMRQRYWFLGHPQDPIELGERIWAFWSIYAVDRTGSISSNQPPVFRDSDICTPFPKPLYEYELGLVSYQDDYSLSSLYDGNIAPQKLPFNTDSSASILYIKALALLERASKLMYLPREAEATYDYPSAPSSNSGSINPPPSVGSPHHIDEYLAYQNYAAETLSQASPTSLQQNSTRCARVRTPNAYEEVRLALLRVESDLAPDRRTPWGMWDGTAQGWLLQAPKKDVVTLHFILGCAWMFLFDVYEYNAENTEAVNVARRLAFTIRCMLPGSLTSDLDVFVSMCWSFVSLILIREVKRLKAIGDLATAAAVDADVDTVLEALKMYGKQHTISAKQADRAENLRSSSVDDAGFISSDIDDRYPERQSTE